MILLNILTELYRKTFRWFRKVRTFRRYGDLTRYHLIDPCYQIGEFTYGIPEIIRYDSRTKLSIGKYCSIAGGVKIMLGGNHFAKYVSTYPFFKMGAVFTNHRGWEEYYKGDVSIGHDVWIGRNAMILSGVSIGDGAIIGAGAVVAKNIPPYAIAVGNPVRIIKYRFTESQIAALLQLQWWNWTPEKINEHLPLICSEDVEELLKKCK